MNPYQAPTPEHEPWNPADHDRSGEVPPEILASMRGTRPWLTLFGVVGFIGTGLMVVGGLAVASVGIGQLQGGVGLVYVVMSALYLFPTLWLWRYKESMTRLEAQGSMASLIETVRAQQAFWRLIGRITMVMLILYGVAIFVAALAWVVLKRST